MRGVQWVLALFLGGFGSVTGLALTVLGWHLFYWDRIYPGVRVGPVDLGGLTREQAEARLQAAFPYPLQGKVHLRLESRAWTVRPLDLGFVVDYGATAEAAWRIGREGGLLQRLNDRWRAWQYGVQVPLIAVFHHGWTYALVMNTVAPWVQAPPQDAYLTLQGTQVVYRDGHPGTRIHWPTLFSLLTSTLSRFPPEADIAVPLETVPPDIPEARDLAGTLQNLLSRPFRLTLPNAQPGDPGPWEIPPEEIVGLLRIVRTEENGRPAYRLQVNPEPLRPFLQELAPQIRRYPQNARFTFDPETRTLHLLEHAVYGRRLDVDASLEAIRRALEAGQSQAQLVIKVQPPVVTDDATAEDLGIRELVAEATTYFYGSSMARMHNIRVAASRFHGLLVAPGEVFSMVAVLGDVSLDNGYKEAPIIYGNRTIQGVGGGVCQVSTTLFRTVFFGGYPIVERHPHTYRVYYYELSPSGRVNPIWAGLDATVYVPIVDFKFKNDTPYWILMEVEVNIPYRYIRWRFYSTSDGREVKWGTTGLYDREPPPEPRYIENPELKPGEVRQTDWPVEGGTVTVWRKVYRNGDLLFEDRFTTHYRPWPAICEYGPGTEGMPPENPDPEHPCRP